MSNVTPWHEDKLFLAYMAGFVDGEGTISLFKRQRGKYLNYVAYMSLPNSNFEVLAYIADRLGGVVPTPKTLNMNRFGKRPMFKLYWSQRAARKTMAALLPFLIVKRQQAEIILSLPVKHGYNTPEEREIKAALNAKAYSRLKEIHGRAER